MESPRYTERPSSHTADVNATHSKETPIGGCVERLVRCPVHARKNLGCSICARVRPIWDTCPDCLGHGFIYWTGAYNDLPNGCVCDRCHGSGNYYPPNTKLSGGGPLSNQTTEAESRRPLE